MSDHSITQAAQPFSAMHESHGVFSKAAFRAAEVFSDSDRFILALRHLAGVPNANPRKGLQASDQFCRRNMAMKTHELLCDHMTKNICDEFALLTIDSADFDTALTRPIINIRGGRKKFQNRLKKTAANVIVVCGPTIVPPSQNGAEAFVAMRLKCLVWGPDLHEGLPDHVRALRALASARFPQHDMVDFQFLVRESDALVDAVSTLWAIEAPDRWNSIAVATTQKKKRRKIAAKCDDKIALQLLAMYAAASLEPMCFGSGEGSFILRRGAAFAKAELKNSGLKTLPVIHKDEVIHFLAELCISEALGMEAPPLAIL